MMLLTGRWEEAGQQHQLIDSDGSYIDASTNQIVMNGDGGLVRFALPLPLAPGAPLRLLFDGWLASGAQSGGAIAPNAVTIVSPASGLAASGCSGARLAAAFLVLAGFDLATSLFLTKRYLGGSAA